MCSERTKNTCMYFCSLPGISLERVKPITIFKYIDPGKTGDRSLNFSVFLDLLDFK